jgi:tRNA(Ile)-lysidine synthase
VTDAALLGASRDRLLRAASRHPLAAACAEGLARCGAANGTRLALLVSGGGDSMALQLLVAAIRERSDPSLDSIAVLTVDHGLRPEARDECAEALALARELGIDRSECVRVEVDPDGNLLDRARAARYAAARAFAERHRCAAVVAAHTADDRAESLLLGLRRGIGLGSLTRLLPVREFADGTLPTILRPLLAVRRAELREFLARLEVRWREDPSNALHDRGALRSDPIAATMVGEIAGGATRVFDEVAELVGFRDEVLAERLGAAATSLARADFDRLPGALRAAALRSLVQRAGGAIAQATLDRALVAIRQRERVPRVFECGGSVELSIDAREVAARSLR